MPDLPAWVDALGGEGAEDRGPICRPCFVVFQVGFADEFGDASGKLVDDGDGFCAAGYDSTVPEIVRGHH